ncbi:MAG: hypothetical protein V2A73_13805 [Pseudomonadota bacterium]
MASARRRASGIAKVPYKKLRRFPQPPDATFEVEVEKCYRKPVDTDEGAREILWVDWTFKKVEDGGEEAEKWLDKPYKWRVGRLPHPEDPNDAEIKGIVDQRIWDALIFLADGTYPDPTDEESGLDEGKLSGVVCKARSRNTSNEKSGAQFCNWTLLVPTRKQAEAEAEGRAPKASAGKNTARPGRR